MEQSLVTIKSVVGDMDVFKSVLNVITKNNMPLECVLSNFGYEYSEVYVEEHNKDKWMEDIIDNWRFYLFSYIKNRKRGKPTNRIMYHISILIPFEYDMVEIKKVIKALFMYYDPFNKARVLGLFPLYRARKDMFFINLLIHSINIYDEVFVLEVREVQLTNIVLELMFSNKENLRKAIKNIPQEYLM